MKIRIIISQCLLTILPSSLLCMKIEDIKSWNAVVTEGSTAKLACKTNTKIERCVWRNEREGLEFDSDQTYNRRDNEVVKIGAAARGLKDNMCFFTIDQTEKDHEGSWECDVEGECGDDMEEDTEYEEDYDEDYFQGRRKRSARERRHDRSCKSGDCST